MKNSNETDILGKLATIKDCLFICYFFSVPNFLYGILVHGELTFSLGITAAVFGSIYIIGKLEKFYAKA